MKRGEIIPKILFIFIILVLAVSIIRTPVQETEEEGFLATLKSAFSLAWLDNLYGDGELYGIECESDEDCKYCAVCSEGKCVQDGESCAYYSVEDDTCHDACGECFFCNEVTDNCELIEGCEPEPIERTCTNCYDKYICDEENKDILIKTASCSNGECLYEEPEIYEECGPCATCIDSIYVPTYPIEEEYATTTEKPDFAIFRDAISFAEQTSNPTKTLGDVTGVMAGPGLIGMFAQLSQLSLAQVVTTAIKQQINYDNCVLFDFYADWCVPCKQMGPHIKELERRGYPIKKINSDLEPELIQKYNVDALPTFVLVLKTPEGGKELGRKKGIITPNDLEQLFTSHFKECYKPPKPPKPPKLPQPIKKVQSCSNPPQSDETPCVCPGTSALTDIDKMTFDGNYPVQNNGNLNFNNLYQYSPTLQNIMSHNINYDYNDDNPVTLVHETTHSINSFLRNTVSIVQGSPPNGQNNNAFYLGDNQFELLPEPQVSISEVLTYIPNNLKIMNVLSPGWNDKSLYILDELISYTHGANVAIELESNNMWTSKGYNNLNSKPLKGVLQSTVNALALYKAVKENDNQYINKNPKFKELIKYLVKKGIDTFKDGNKFPVFRGSEQNALWNNLLDSGDFKETIKELYGEAGYLELLTISDSSTQPPTDPDKECWCQNQKCVEKPDEPPTVPPTEPPITPEEPIEPPVEPVEPIQPPEEPKEYQCKYKITIDIKAENEDIIFKPKDNWDAIFEPESFEVKKGETKQLIFYINPLTTDKSVTVYWTAISKSTGEELTDLIYTPQESDIPGQNILLKMKDNPNVICEEIETFPIPPATKPKCIEKTPPPEDCPEPIEELPEPIEKLEPICPETPAPLKITDEECTKKVEEICGTSKQPLDNNENPINCGVETPNFKIVQTIDIRTGRPISRELAEKITCAFEYHVCKNVLEWTNFEERLILKERKVPVIVVLGIQASSGGGASSYYPLLEGPQVTEIKLKGINANEILTSIIPHEATHIATATIFKEKDITGFSRAISEGISTISETQEDKCMYFKNFIKAATSTPPYSFTIDNLIAMSDNPHDPYPDQRIIKTFYAQSNSIVEFLLRQGGGGCAAKKKLIDVVNQAMSQGWPKALKDNYGFNNLQDFQNKFTEYIENQLGPETPGSTYEDWIRTGCNPCTQK